MLPNFMEGGHLRHLMPLLLPGGIPPENFAGIHPPTLCVGGQVHNAIVPVPQLSLKVVFFARVLLNPAALQVRGNVNPRSCDLNALQS